MKTLSISPQPTDALSFYRGFHPLRRLKEAHPEFSFGQPASINWATLTEYDNVFLQRPFTPDHSRIAEIAKNWQFPLILDYDDYLLELGHDNRAKAIFDASVEEVKKSTKLGDLMFVTTQHLKLLKEKMGAKNVVVVPNAYDDRLFPYAKKKNDKLKICLWRGSNTHNKDILSVLPGLERLIEAHPTWQFVFMAYSPEWMFKKTYENVHYVGPKNMLEYMLMIWQMAPSIMYHPLHNSDFNRAKSMCSWLEATHAGAAFVGPNFEEYTRPGIINYEADNPDSFFDAMNALITNPKTITDKNEESAKHISECLTLDIVNELRWEALKKLHRTT